MHWLLVALQKRSRNLLLPNFPCLLNISTVILSLFRRSHPLWEIKCAGLGSGRYNTYSSMPIDHDAGATASPGINSVLERYLWPSGMKAVQGLHREIQRAMDEGLY
jgi:hypothetical protein